MISDSSFNCYIRITSDKKSDFFHAGYQTKKLNFSLFTFMRENSTIFAKDVETLPRGMSVRHERVKENIMINLADFANRLKPYGRRPTRLLIEAASH